MYKACGRIDGNIGNNHLHFEPPDELTVTITYILYPWRIDGNILYETPNPHPAKLIYLISPTWSCVSLPRPKTSRGWKLLILV